MFFKYFKISEMDIFPINCLNISDIPVTLTQEYDGYDDYYYYSYGDVSNIQVRLQFVENTTVKI